MSLKDLIKMEQQKILRSQEIIENWLQQTIDTTLDTRVHVQKLLRKGKFQDAMMVAEAFENDIKIIDEIMNIFDITQGQHKDRCFNLLKRYEPLNSKFIESEINKMMEMEEAQKIAREAEKKYANLYSYIPYSDTYTHPYMDIPNILSGLRGQRKSTTNPLIHDTRPISTNPIETPLNFFETPQPHRKFFETPQPPLNFFETPQPHRKFFETPQPHRNFFETQRNFFETPQPPRNLIETPQPPRNLIETPQPPRNLIETPQHLKPGDPNYFDMTEIEDMQWKPLFELLQEWIHRTRKRVFSSF
jgi:hypothetical protein